MNDFGAGVFDPTPGEIRDTFHDWLYSACGRGDSVTVVDLMEELRLLRSGPRPDIYDDLPRSAVECQQMLQKLEADGRAVRDGSFWRWAEGKAKAGVETQKALF